MSQEFERASDIEPTPSGQAKRWQAELKASEGRLERFQKRGKAAIDAFKDERDTGEADIAKLNVYTSDTVMRGSALYGETPKVKCTRRWADPKDDVARVSAEMMERILNLDIEKDSDTYATALAYALDDWLKPGLGFARLRYVVETEDVPGQPAQTREVPAVTDPMTGQVQPARTEEIAPAVPATKKKTKECVETDYVNWKKMLWDAGANVFHDARWWAFELQMTRDAAEKRWGEEVSNKLPLDTRKDENGKEVTDPWARARIWEIHDKENRETVWWCKGYPDVLETKKDALGLDGYWSFPRPLMANTSTDELVPVPGYYLAQDQYGEVNRTTERLRQLYIALRVVGIYDKSADGVKQLLEAGVENRLIPVENWAMFAEKGGLKGAVDWFPIEQVANVIQILETQRANQLQLLQRVTGATDLDAGASMQSNTATESAIKDRRSRIRNSREQKEFNRFASDLQRLKAEIIARHFDPETIIRLSNVLLTDDASLAQKAVDLIKSDPCGYRVAVEAESVALEDAAAKRSERTEAAQSAAAMVQGFTPLVQAMPAMTPFFLESLKYVLAGFPGSGGVEAVLDQTVDKIEAEMAAPKPPTPPDPRMVAAQTKAEAEMFKAKADVQKTQVDTQAHMMTTQADMQMKREEHQMKRVEMADKMASDAMSPGAEQ